MKKWFNKNKLLFAGIVTGGIIGFFYWKYIGCLSGTCAITSSPVNSTLYFSVIGALVFGLFKKNPKEKTHVK